MKEEQKLYRKNKRAYRRAIRQYKHLLKHTTKAALADPTNTDFVLTYIVISLRILKTNYKYFVANPKSGVSVKQIIELEELLQQYNHWTAARWDMHLSNKDYNKIRDTFFKLLANFIDIKKE